MDLGSDGKNIKKNKWLAAISLSESRQAYIAKEKEKEADGRRKEKKKGTLSKGKKVSSPKKPVEKKRNEGAGIQSKLLDEPTDNDGESKELDPLSKRRRVVTKRTIEKVRRRLAIETEGENKENDSFLELTERPLRVETLDMESSTNFEREKIAPNKSRISGD